MKIEQFMEKYRAMFQPNVFARATKAETLELAFDCLKLVRTYSKEFKMKSGTRLFLLYVWTLLNAIICSKITPEEISLSKEEYNNLQDLLFGDLFGLTCT